MVAKHSGTLLNVKSLNDAGRKDVLAHMFSHVHFLLSSPNTLLAPNPQPQEFRVSRLTPI